VNSHIYLNSFWKIVWPWKNKNTFSKQNNKKKKNFFI
jgi:hypothetical protein